MEDILSWSEAFTIYTLVLTSYFPERWRDLTCYKLLILHTCRQFGGKVWLTYDRAFREHAAAANTTDWSVMNVQLFNFHIAGATGRSQARRPLVSAEAKGSDNPTAELCRSWNRDKCASPYELCMYAHRCAKCKGSHRASACTQASRSRAHSPDSYSAFAKRKRS